MLSSGCVGCRKRPFAALGKWRLESSPRQCPCSFFTNFGGFLRRNATSIRSVHTQRAEIWFSVNYRFIDTARLVLAYFLTALPEWGKVWLKSCHEKNLLIVAFHWMRPRIDQRRWAISYRANYFCGILKNLALMKTNNTQFLPSRQATIGKIWPWLRQNKKRFFSKLW